MDDLNGIRVTESGWLSLQSCQPDYDDNYCAEKTHCEKCLTVYLFDRFYSAGISVLSVSMADLTRENYQWPFTSTTFLESRQIQISAIARPPM